jgi:uncharacterized damage-inducible protein DinB
MTEKEQFLGVWEKEYPTTLKVLKAYPGAQADLKPHDRARSARELAWTFVFEGTAAADAIDGKLELPPKSMPAMPDRWDGMVSAVERSFRAIGDKIRNTPDAELNKTIKFFVAPKQMGDVRKLDFLWFLLMDMVHHRGQFSVYLRMADGKVPSIYGPSGDEPWM